MNCGGAQPSSIEELMPLFEVTDPASIDAGFNPDIYVIGLQEIVKLNAKNCLIKDKKRIELWSTLLDKTLAELNKRIQHRTRPKLTE